MRLGVADRSKFEVIPLGLELDRFLALAPEPGGPFRDELGVGPDEVLATFVGRLAPIKRVDVLLRAFARARQLGAPVRLAVVGDGEPRAELEALAASLGCAGAVTFTGYRRDLDAIVAGTDIAVLSSDNEGTPVSLIEAAAGARPMVATRAGGVPDVVAPGTGLLADRGDDEALGVALHELARDPGRRRAMGARAREHAAARYRWERLVGRMEELYERLLPSGAAGHDRAAARVAPAARVAARRRRQGARRSAGSASWAPPRGWPAATSPAGAAGRTGSRSASSARSRSHDFSELLVLWEVFVAEVYDVPGAAARTPRSSWTSAATSAPPCCGSPGAIQARGSSGYEADPATASVARRNTAQGAERRGAQRRARRDGRRDYVLADPRAKAGHRARSTGDGMSDLACRRFRWTRCSQAFDRPVDVLKLDIEGAEHPGLAAARRLDRVDDDPWPVSRRGGGVSGTRCDRSLAGLRRAPTMRRTTRAARSSPSASPRARQRLSPAAAGRAAR